MAYSDDGASWTAVSESDSTFTVGQIRAIAYGNGRWIAGGSYGEYGQIGQMAYSSDGASWTAVADTAFEQNTLPALNGIAYGDGRWVVGTHENGLWYSDD